MYDWEEEGILLKKEIIAYHEAGHAVIGIILDKKIDYVTIEKFNNKLGETKFIEIEKDLFIDQLEDEWRKHIICIFAGGLSAEKIDDGYDWELHSISDIEKVVKIATTICNKEKDVEEYCMKQREEAIKLINLYWVKIDLLAKELLIQNRLNGDQIKILINQM